jgi:hypothetical protein
LAQGTVKITPELANVTTAMVDAFKKQSKAASGAGGLIPPPPPPPTNAISAPPKRGGYARSASTSSALPAPPPPPRNSVGGGGGFGRPSSQSIDGYSASASYLKSLKPPNHLELSLGAQLQVCKLRLKKK